MAPGDIHTVPYGARWANQVEGQPAPVTLHDTQLKAIERGRDLACRREVEHFIHDQNGTRPAALNG